MLSLKNLKPVYVLSRSAVTTTVNAGGSSAVLFSATIPANALGENGRIEVKADVSSSGTVGARVLTLTLDDGGGATTIGAGTMSAVGTRLEASITNRNARNSQRGSINNVVNMSITTGTSTASEDMSLDCTLRLLITNPSDNVTIESYSVEVWP